MAALPDAYLWIAGEGPERAALTRQAQELGGDGPGTVPGLARRCPRPAGRGRHFPLLLTARTAGEYGHRSLGARHAGGRRGVARAFSQLIQDGVNGLLMPDRRCSGLGESRRLAHQGCGIGPGIGAGRETPPYRGQYTEGHVVQQYQDFFERSPPTGRPPHGGRRLMCGIAGVMMRHGAGVSTRKLLDALVSALQHRGPDGSGRHWPAMSAWCRRGSPSSICRPAISPCTSRAARHLSRMARSTTTSNYANKWRTRRSAPIPTAKCRSG